jgi:hypothetical protein
MLAVCLQAKRRQLVSIIVIVSVMMHLITVDINQQRLMTDPVCLDSVEKLLARDLLLFEDQLLDS